MRRPTIAAGFGALLLGACSPLAPRPDRSRFYVLTPLVLTDPTSSATLPGRRLALGLGPVNVPPYLDRPEVVTRVNPNELKPAGYERWAEPLGTQIRGTLAMNLATLLKTDRVVAFPWYGGTALDYVVTVDVYAFERDPENRADLVARWLVKDGRAGTVLRAEETRLHEAAASETTADLVAALSRALGELSRAIASAIEGFRAQSLKAG